MDKLANWQSMQLMGESMRYKNNKSGRRSVLHYHPDFTQEMTLIDLFPLLYDLSTLVEVAVLLETVLKFSVAAAGSWGIFTTAVEVALVGNWLHRT